jgi:hypothetical protein
MDPIQCPTRNCKKTLQPSPSKLDQSGNCYVLAIEFYCSTCQYRSTLPDPDTRQYSKNTNKPLGSSE